MDRLLNRLVTECVERRSVRLSSGKTSDFFVDCKKVILSAEGHSLVAERLYACIQAMSERPQAVVGVAVGGCSLASAVAMLSFQRGTPMDAIYVRKATKEHGSKRRVEGAHALAEGAGVIILEDVVTTGGSTLRAVDALRIEGLRVLGVIALVDRCEGGRGAVESAGVSFTSLYTRQVLMGESV